jgi:repressor of nif and glnA expression
MKISNALEKAAREMIDASRMGEVKRLHKIAETYGVEMAEATLAYVTMRQDMIDQGLSDAERKFLKKTYKNGTLATPKLTEIEDDSQHEVAKALSQRGLLTFTSIPSFVLISKRGIRYVEEFEVNKKK